MAKNDVVLLDGIIDQRVSEGLPSNERDEVFEYFAFEQLLKNYDLSIEEIETGWTDGRDDGGIDGFYVFINGNVLTDADEFIWPRANASIDVWLVTCKHHATFQQAPLDGLLASLQELFDLSLEPKDFHGAYSEELLAARTLFILAYRRLSITHPRLTFNVAYVSRGDIQQLGESVAARARQIEGLLSSLFSSSSAKFSFVGASELIAAHRRQKSFALALPFVEHLATGKESYVLLVRLDEYCKFVTDEPAAFGGTCSIPMSATISGPIRLMKTSPHPLPTPQHPTSGGLTMASRFWPLVLRSPARPYISKTFRSSMAFRPPKRSSVISTMAEKSPRTAPYEGRRNPQRDGVVFDRSGNVIATDPDRVP